MHNEDLKDCPFCGCTPYFSGDVSDWQDDGRYIQLTIGCCVSMTESIIWRKARDMSPAAIDKELRERLTERWNTRFTDESNYHPCTYILIEGLKNLPGGYKVLSDWDIARAKIDQQGN